MVDKYSMLKSKWLLNRDEYFCSGQLCCSSFLARIMTNYVNCDI